MSSECNKQGWSETISDNYRIEDGEWWYHDKRRRLRCTIYTCETCGKLFPRPASGTRHREKKGYKITVCSLECCQWTGHGEISGKFWNGVLRSAAKRGIEVLVTIEKAWELWVAEGPICALSGLPITLKRPRNAGNKSRTWITASLDRIDSKKPYEAGNIQWLHKDVNMMKQSLSKEDFIEFCRKIAERNPRAA